MTRAPNPSRPVMTEAEREAMVALAERCEWAPGPDRELDELIAAEIAGAVREYQPHLGRAAYYHESGSPWMYVNVPEPGYTASLDAAMTLMDRYGVLLHLSDIGADGLPLCNIGDSVTGREFKGIGTANLALAICAASLRARANQGTPA